MVDVATNLTEALFVHTGYTINVRNNPVASESAVTQLTTYDKIFINYTYDTEGRTVAIKYHEDASNLDFVYCNVFTKDGFFRNVWVATKNTVTGTIYLQTQPFFNNVVEQLQNDINKGGHFLRPRDGEDREYYPINYYYANNGTNYDAVDIRVEKDTEIYDHKGNLVGILHGHTDKYKYPIVATGSNTDFDMGETLKEFVAVKYVGVEFVYDNSIPVTDYITFNAPFTATPQDESIYIRADSLSKKVRL